MYMSYSSITLKQKSSSAGINCVVKGSSSGDLHLNCEKQIDMSFSKQSREL